METTQNARTTHVPWNKGKLTGQKPPLKLKEIWAIRIRLQLASNHGSWRCSSWPLIVNFVGVIWWR